MRRKLALGALLLLLALCACVPRPDAPAQDVPPVESRAVAWEDLEVEDSLELAYARQFSVDFCTGGYAKISIRDSGDALLVPEGAQVPAGVPEGVAVLQAPLDQIYLAATSAMDLFRELDAVGAVTLSGTDVSGWYIPEARQAMESGRMVYAGKYSAPDYELILDRGCDLALESTMIYHSPEVREQLERFGVPVLVERSSYENHPLGRMEWIKLYGVLLGKREQAEEYFTAQLQTLAPILEQESTGKTVAFFSITSNGAVNVHKSEDYIAQSIGLAGGEYIFSDLGKGENALSTVNMQMEAFYDAAREADVLIYNSAIDAELDTVDQLLEKSPLLADFKAVQEGRVWCTGKNLFQESLGLGDFIRDLNAILTAEDPAGLELTYLHRLT